MTRKLCFTHGRVMPTVSHSWNASWPIACGGHLAGDDDHRDRIHVRGGDAGHRVGDAGTRGHQRDADLLRRARVAVGRVHGALLVAHQHVLDLLLLEQLVVDVEDRAARIAEDVLDAFFLEAADDDFRARELHGYPPSAKMDSARPARASGASGAASSFAGRAGWRVPQGFDRVESRESGKSAALPGRLLGACGAAGGSDATADIAVQHPGARAPGSKTLPAIGGAGQGRGCRSRCTLRCATPRRARGGVDLCLPIIARESTSAAANTGFHSRNLRVPRRASSVAPSSRRCSPCATRTPRWTSCRTPC